MDKVKEYPAGKQKEEPMNKSDLARMAGNIASGLVANPGFKPDEKMAGQDIADSVAAAAVAIARSIVVELDHETTEDPEMAKLPKVEAVDIKTEPIDGNQE